MVMMMIMVMMVEEREMVGILVKRLLSVDLVRHSLSIPQFSASIHTYTHTTSSYSQAGVSAGE